MKTKKIFLASSSELQEDREQFEILISRKNSIFKNNGILLELVIWENFIDAISETRLQDEYNKKIKSCDVFVMLFYTKVGKYTEEEFDMALQTFQTEGKPLVYTYFKNVPIDETNQSERDKTSLEAFKAKLKSIGHFKTQYENIDQLKFHFSDQLDKLVSEGFFNESSENLIATIKKEVPSAMSLSKLVEKHEGELLKLDPDAENSLILFKSRANGLERNLTMGILSADQANLERNRLNAALLSILDGFE